MSEQSALMVLPNPCRLLSRELLYTALTRQTERVVIPASRTAR
jgi:ATP-dependent exoDNAse (exonuclease V) alpha subunit